jgi:ABC-type thiamin/hydroxymethylpyrimidine transport system permease subunit
MKRSALVCIVLSVVFLAVALFSYLYESRSTGLLPVITYPLRDYTVLFAVICVVLVSCGIFIQKRRENR